MKMIKWAALVVACGTASSAFSAGYVCESNCVVISPQEYAIFILGSVSAEGGKGRYRKRELYEMLKAECTERAREAGLKASAILVDHVSFDKNQVDESSSSSANGWSTYREVGVKVAESRGPRRRYSRMAAIDAAVGLSATSEHSESARHEKGLSANVTFATSASACRDEAEIGDREVPLYPGSEPVLGGG